MKLLILTVISILNLFHNTGLVCKVFPAPGVHERSKA